MPATEVNQYFVEVKPLWVGKVGASGVSSPTSHTIPADSVVGLTEGNVYIITANRTNASGSTKNPSSERETFIGKLSGSDFIDCVRQVEGQAQGWGAGVVLEILFSATCWNKLIEGILVHTNLDGTLKFPTNLKASFEEINTGTQDGKIITPKGLKDSNVAFLDDIPSVPVKASVSELIEGSNDSKYATALGLVPFLNNSFFRQALTNGNFGRWIRGTIFNFTDTSIHYLADRWSFFNNSATNANTDITQQDISAILPGSKYGMRIQRKAGSTYANTIYLQQSLESIDSIKLVGKKLTLSFYLRVGANWTGGNIRTRIYSGTGTDQQYPAAYTNSSAEASIDVTPTTNYVKYTVTMPNVLAVSKTQIGIELRTNVFSGTAGADDWFEIAQAQLNVGDVALPFIPKSQEEEQRNCDRFCQAYITTASSEIVALGAGASATVAYLTFKLRSTMRTTPTLTATAADWKLDNAGTDKGDLTSLTIESGFFGANGGYLNAQVASGLTANVPYALRGDETVGRKLIFSAEL